MLAGQRQVPNHVACAAAGALAGLASGLTGLGGGTILVPLLTSLAGLSQHAAHGTSLAVLAASSALSSTTYLTRGAADLRLAALVALFGAISSRAGARLTRRLHHTDLRWLLGWYLYASALLVLARPLLSSSSGTFPHHLAAAFAGAASGIAAGLFGVGGGTIVIPALTILAGITQKAAQGTSLAAALPVAISGALTHARIGQVDRRAFLSSAPAAAVGAWAGALLATGLPQDTLRYCYCAFLLLLSLRYILEV